MVLKDASLYACVNASGSWHDSWIVSYFYSCLVELLFGYRVLQIQRFQGLAELEIKSCHH
jgi:hypothetical protein